jgi:hypothetical protein
MDKTIKTRDEYMNGKVEHREYYAQFITDEMVKQVKDNIGIERIKASKDKHLNDIPMKEWDGLSGISFKIINGSQTLASRPQVSHKFVELCKQAGEGISPSTLVCVYKEIARQLAEGKR